MEWVLSLYLLYAKHSKSTTQKPSPLGEGGRREPDGRGELAIYLDCFTTNAPIPTHHANKTALNA